MKIAALNPEVRLLLESGAVHLWLCRADHAIGDAALLARYKTLLTSDELKRCGRIRDTGQQHSAMLTRVLVRTALSEYDNTEPQDWRFSADARDKPRIDNANATLRFNVSHSREWIVCAIGTGFELGVDVEYCHRDRDILRLAKRYFSPQEYAALGSLAGEARADRFYDLWTLKESWLKATGLGISGGLDSAVFDLREDGDMSFSVPAAQITYRFSNWQLDSSYRLALCYECLEHRTAPVTLYQTQPLVKSWVKRLPVRYG
jgi:4'-phosphopantetheinyl transferase